MSQVSLLSLLCLQSHRCFDADYVTVVIGIATSVTGVVGASISFGVFGIMGTTIKAAGREEEGGQELGARGTMVLGRTAPAAQFLWLLAALWLGAGVVRAVFSVATRFSRGIGTTISRAVRFTSQVTDTTRRSGVSVTTTVVVWGRGIPGSWVLPQFLEFPVSGVSVVVVTTIPGTSGCGHYHHGQEH